MVPLHASAASRQNRTSSPSPFLFARILFAVLLALGGSQLAAQARTWTVGAGAGNDYQNLQLAINAAQPGDTISVQADETFYGPFVLKNKNTTSTAYITIQSSAVGSLPAGARVGPTQSSLMPHLVQTGNISVIRTEPGAHHYQLIGLHITSVPEAFVGDMVSLGDGSTKALNDFVPGGWQAQRNVIVIDDSHDFWVTVYPRSFSEVGFTDLANFDLRLTASSPYKGQATDGKDIGVDMDALEAALGNRYALSLDGIDDYVNVPANAANNLNLTGPLTLEAWVKYTPNSNFQNIVSKECYGTTGCGGYALQITNTGKLRMIFYRGGTSFVAVSGATTITQSEWHHVAGVFDGSEIRVYLDGAQDGSGASQAPVSGTAPLVIGRRSSTSQYYLNGLIDEVRVSAAALYDSDFTPDQSPRVMCGTTKGLWKFDGQVYADNSGNGNTGTAQGSLAFSTDVP